MMRGSATTMTSMRNSLQGGAGGSGVGASGVAGGQGSSMGSMQSTNMSGSSFGGTAGSSTMGFSTQGRSMGGMLGGQGNKLVIALCRRQFDDMHEDSDFIDGAMLGGEDQPQQ